MTIARGGGFVDSAGETVAGWNVLDRLTAAVSAATASLPAEEVTVHREVPVTTPARTLLDLAATGTLGRLELALNEAQVRRAPLPLTHLRGAAAPRPHNATILGFEVDAYWPDRGLVAEVDGYAAHLSRRAFERDHHRDQVLTAHGLRVVRFTWWQITRTPEALVARLAGASAA